MRRIIGILLLIAGSFAPLATAQTYSQREFFASDFGQWRVPSQQANTYQWSPGSICNASAAGLNFQPFATNAPVFIQDVTAANSEVVTPSVVTVTATQCSVTVSAQNQHYSFSIASATGGLQEALNQIASANIYPVTVVLDRNWYTLAASVSGTSPAAIITAAKGSSAAYLVDRTTVPATYYWWNGTNYVVSGISAASIPNTKVSSYTAIAAPTALTTVGATCASAGGGCITSTTTGGTVPANSAAYRLGATCVDPSGGETTLSIDTASGAVVTPAGAASTSTISVTSPAGCTVANGAVGWRLYMSAASGASLSEILYSPTCTATSLQSTLPSATVCAIGSTATISAVVTGKATIPLVATAYPRLPAASQSWPPFTAGGTLASTAVGELGHVNFPAGWFNTLGRSIQFCGNGFATTNGTGGTVTFSTDLASVYGVTVITPFTAVSGTIAGSVIQLPFNFCATYTTSATGASGTVEAHGCVNYGVAGTAVGSVSCDIIFAASSAVDLTKADSLVFNIKPTTAGLTAYQLRQLTAYPGN